MYSELKIKCPSGRGYVEYYFDGKRHREYNGHRLSLPIHPNNATSLADKKKLLIKLKYELEKALEQGWNPVHNFGEAYTTDTGETVKTRKQPPIPVNDPPTFLEITTPNQKEVVIGKTFTIKFKTDAHPSLFSNPDWFFSVIEPHSFGSYTGSARVVDGYGIVYFKTWETVEDGTEATITLELRPPRQKTISDNLTVLAAPMPVGADTKDPGNKNTPNIEIIPVSENDPYYKDHGWSNSTVAEIADDQDAIFIYINDSNTHLAKLIERAQQYSTQTVESIKNRYREHIGFCAFMISRNKIENRLEAEEGKALPLEQVEQIKKADLENGCETICGMISDFFDYIRTETEE